MPLYPPSTGGGGGANTTLSNLDSPTEINQDLQAPLGSDLNLKTVDNGAGDSDNIKLSPGSATGIKGKVKLCDEKLVITDVMPSDYWGTDVPAFMGDAEVIADSNVAIFYGSTDISTNIYSNDVVLQSGQNDVVSSTFSTGQVSIITGLITDSGASGQTGPIDVLTGDNSGSNNSGAINIRSGNSTAQTGNIGLNTGSSSGTNSGELNFNTGTAPSGNSGNVNLSTGAASGTRGYIRFDSLVAVLPTGTSDPSTSYPSGSCYYNTSTNNFRVLNGGTWRGILLV